MADVEFLLGGPRGRRLSLELAMDADPVIRAAVMQVAYDLDPGAGRSRVILTLSGSPDGEPASVPARPTVAEVAAGIAALDLGTVDPDRVRYALQRSVDTARYWQDPDGEDVLAATDEVAAALAHVAASLLESPATQWWRQGCGPGQWAIDWRPANDAAPLPRNPQTTLAEWGRKERLEEVRAERERPKDPRANLSGEWWSIPHGLVQTVQRIPEGLSLVEDSLGWEDATAIPVTGTGRILEIRTAEDWTALCRAFPLESTASRRHDWFRTTGRHGRWLIPDWELAASEWDAVHLTVSGYLNAAGRALRVDQDTATVIAGWDPGSTIWITDVARESEQPRQFWHRPANEDDWTQIHGG
ncbi:hypothetical protein [Paenarthrobacter nitroguajacolicus]|uniref:hypothetical protein n=1 Tax=Paenarthrobacter nitroguajacolicus TaxID=211146 RepID=UPI00248CA008|nr:hypothetical protein [Paenarthrobacter nitroguajacolicus]MDI2036788.1 hypothetical protein [Paenarthrobacter nitroguajacolicus]